MNSCIASKEEFKAVEVPYRQDEKYWVFQSGPEEINVYYSLNFHSEMEVVAARICTLEMKNIGPAVKVKPNI
jgi:hypothetical protein